MPGDTGPVTIGAPAISVIVVSAGGGEIGECLASLHRQQGDIDAEVVVVDAGGRLDSTQVAQQFPNTMVLRADGGRTIPALRAAALRRTRGDIVAVMNEYCVADPRWYEEMVGAHRAHPECVAVGGAVENGSRTRLTDWAAYFCEYSTYMLPVPAQTVDDIPGHNVSYKRRAFEHIPDLDGVLSRGFWESTLHPILRRRGERFLSSPSVVVYYKKRFGFGQFLRQRYHYSRYYAGEVVAGTAWLRRLLRMAAASALPAVLLGRIIARVARKRRHLRELALSSPMLVIFTAVWAAGEAVGALLGPGRSLHEVR